MRPAPTVVNQTKRKWLHVPSSWQRICFRLVWFSVLLVLLHEVHDYFDEKYTRSPGTGRRVEKQANLTNLDFFKDHLETAAGVHSAQAQEGGAATSGHGEVATSTARPFPQAIMDCWPQLVGDVILGSKMVPNRYIVNIGANDGKNIDETWYWLGREGAEGMAIECSSKSLPKLRMNYNNARNKVTIISEFATPDTIVRIFKEAAVPEFFFLLKIDIDSYDVEVVEMILSAGYRPALVFVEINEKIPPPFRFKIKYARGSGAKQFYWHGGHLFGASLMSWADCFQRQNYKLLGLQYGNNLLYARHDLVHNGVGADPGCSYVEGYYHPFTKLRPPKAYKYQWNVDVAFFFDLHQPGKWETAARIIKDKLLETSRETARRNQVALRQTGNSSVVEWPNVPDKNDMVAADFKRSCERLEVGLDAAPRVKLHSWALRPDWEKGIANFDSSEFYTQQEVVNRGFGMSCSGEGLTSNEN